MPKSRTGAAVAAVAAILALQATAYLIVSPRAPADGARAPTSKARIVETSIYDTLRAGDASPLGIKAGGVSASRMLELANASLFSDAGGRNTEEAAFWLKRFFIASGDERTRRAMTQLGTTFAAPSRGTPDYASARHAWEIAAAQGDPVAMCFIAKLYESGLGGVTDRAGADRWTEMARPLGGCSGP